MFQHLVIGANPKRGTIAAGGLICLVEMIEEPGPGTQIKVIGVGGGGGKCRRAHDRPGRARRRIHLRQYRRTGTQPFQGRSIACNWKTGPGAGAKPEVTPALKKPRPASANPSPGPICFHHRRHGRWHRHRRRAGDRPRGQRKWHPDRRRGDQAFEFEGSRRSMADAGPCRTRSQTSTC